MSLAHTPLIIYRPGATLIASRPGASKQPSKLDDSLVS